jgi:hypothetical protein
MADWAGAYGAGGAANALQDIVAQRFLERKQAEVERAQRAQEAQAQAELAQRAEQQRQMLALQHAELAGSRDERYQDRTQRVRQMDMATQRQTVEDQIRAKERADTSIDKTTEREDEQAFRAEENDQNRRTQLDVVAAAGRARDNRSAERTIRVSYTDPETGQNVEEYLTADEARQRGKLKPATKGAAGMKEKLADLFETERIARGILTKGKEMQWRGVGPLAGRVTSIGNDLIGNDPQVAALHSEIGNVFSMISNERFGAALTAQELARATTFLPQKTDPAPVLEQKLNNLIAFAESKRQNMGGSQMSDTATETAQGGLAPGTRRVINGVPAEWDGQGWAAVEQAAPTQTAPKNASELFTSRRR